MPGKDKMFFRKHASWNGVRRGLWVYVILSSIELWIAVVFQKYFLGDDIGSNLIRGFVWVLVIVFVGGIALRTSIRKILKVRKANRELNKYMQGKSLGKFESSLGALDNKLKARNSGSDQAWILLNAAAYALFEGADIELLRRMLKRRHAIYDLWYWANYDDILEYNYNEDRRRIKKPTGILYLYYPDPLSYSRPNTATCVKELVLWELLR